MVRAKIVKKSGKKARITYSKEAKRFARLFKSIIPERFHFIFNEPVVINLIGEDELYQREKLKEIKNVLLEKEMLRIINKKLETMTLQKLGGMNVDQLNLNLGKLNLNKERLVPLIPVPVEYM
jgi:hypothetical protein